MAELSLFEPEILRGVVQKLPVRPEYVLLNKVPKTTTPYPHFEWDIIRGSRQMATPNVPNSEAHIVAGEGFERQSASLVYLREKVVFQPTTLHWLRQIGTLSDKTRAEEAVIRDIDNLNVRFDNFWEWTLWQALQGSLSFSFPDVKANVDYGFLPSHKPTAAVGWDTATPQQIVANIQAWKEVLRTDGNVSPEVAYLTTATLTRIIEAFTGAGISLMSDRMKDEYFNTGTLKGFLGLNWTPVDSTYDVKNSDGTLSQVGFLPDDKVVLANLSTNRPMELVQGPTADDSAPAGFTGRFAKSWKEDDPSARQCLLEEHALPVVTRPEQILVASV